MLTVFGEERVQMQTAPKRQGKIDLAELANALNPYPRYINLRPLWRLG
jgi:hypothetical protein